MRIILTILFLFNMGSLNAKAIGLSGDFEFNYKKKSFFAKVRVIEDTIGHKMTMSILDGVKPVECEFRVRVITAAQPIKNRNGVVIPFAKDCREFSKFVLKDFDWQPIIKYQMVKDVIDSSIEIKGLSKPIKLKNFKILSDVKE